MKTIKLTVLLLASLTFYSAKAQVTDSTRLNRPVQVSFFYPLGTNGLNSPQYTNNFSFNVLYGVNGGVNGLEIGGMVNTNLGAVNGIQIGGLANVNSKHADGMMVAGITNVVKDSSNSIAIAGISNIIGKSANGIQIAGISNTVNGNYYGIQMAGITNINNGNLFGIQTSGISNTNNGNLIGAQIAGISNLNLGDLSGIQIGLLNKAKKVNGLQLGLFNFAEEFERGVPFGLISVVKKGFHALDLSISESIYANATLKIGVDNLYTIYKAGYTSNSDHKYYSYGLGVGSMLNLSKRFKIALDVTGNHIIRQPFKPEFDFLAKSDLTLRFNLNRYVAFFAGPSFNVYLSEHQIADASSQALNVPYTLYAEDWWYYEGSTSIWVGASGGLSIMF